MTNKEVVKMSSLLQRVSLVLVLSFLLRVVLADLEKPESPTTINRTASLVFGISQQQGNTTNNYVASVRESKARKVESPKIINITTSTDRPISLAVHSTPENRSEERILVKTTSTPHTVTSKNRRSTPHRKYSNHHYSVNHHSETEDKRKISVTNEDYSEQQFQNYQPDYYVPQSPEYEDPYSTIPVNQGHTGYDGLIAEPYYDTYPIQDQGYFGPPIPGLPVNEKPPIDVRNRNCNCPETRQMICENPSADFIALIGSLGANLWALIQLIATSSLPFIIPMLVIKLILVPIGIMKFLALIKIFFKLFIILPFFVRHIYPIFTHNFNLHDLLFQKIQDVAAHVHEHSIPLSHDEDIESRNNYNGSSTFRHEIYDSVNDTKIWDLRGCPSKVACELGAFLSTSTYVNFPQKLANYLSKRADRVEPRSKSNANNDENEVDYDDEDEEQDRIQQQDEAFKAFVIALGKKWTKEQCEIYSCSVLF